MGTTSDSVKLPEEKVLATPSVRRLAAEHNVGPEFLGILTLEKEGSDSNVCFSYRLSCLH